MSTSNRFNPVRQFQSLSQRNVGIIYMILNRLGVPSNLHEFVIALYVSGNWEVADTEEISLMRMARNISSGEDNQRKAYNRLRLSSPEFFKWQAGQYFWIVEREIVKDDDKSYKTRSRYKLLIYRQIQMVMDMPQESFQKDIRAKVEEVFMGYPEEANPPKQSKPRGIESDITAIENALRRLVSKTGSVEAAFVEISEEAKESELLRRVLQLAGQLERF